MLLYQFENKNFECLSYQKKTRALTRILKTGVPEPSLPKSGSPTIQKNIASLKNGSSSTKMGVQDCKSAVSESSEDIKII